MSLVFTCLYRVFGFGVRTLLGWRVQGFFGLGLGLRFFSL